MERIYDFVISGIDGNGQQYMTGMLEPERLDQRGYRNGKAFSIDLYHRKNQSKLLVFDWIGGAPNNFKLIATFKDEILCEADVIPLLERYNLIEKKG